MPETTTTASLVLRKLLTGTGYTPPTWNVGLSTTDIYTTGSGATEPGGNGYARQSMVSDSWTVAEDSIISNASQILFSEASGSGWGVIKEIFISDAGSVIYFHQPLNPNITVNGGTTVVIPPECLIIKRDSTLYETE